MSSCQVCSRELDAGAAFCPQCGTPRGSSKPTDPMLGRTIIGQYVIKQRLGEGGMGAVYLADQPSVGRQAVVKVMHPTLSADPGVAPRFEVEARAASQLNHPHIITIYNYGAMEDGTLFLAMEYVKGPSLEDVLAQGPLAAGRVAAIGVQICDALGEAHRHGVVHRDLKPSNIMLARVGRQQDFVKVLDFGIAKVEGVKMTRTGSVIGTPQYMSPEQLRGDALDGRSDLYALGCILYQMASGELPFAADTAAGFMHKHLNEAPTPPALKNPEVAIPPGLEAVIIRALAKDPAERFPDADALGRALEVCRDGGVLPLTAQAAAAPHAPAPRAGKAALWIALSSGLLLLLAAGVTLYMVYGRSQHRAPSSALAAGGSGQEKPVWQKVEGPQEALEPPVAVAKETTVDGGSNKEQPKAEASPATSPRRRRGKKTRRVRRRIEQQEQQAQQEQQKRVALAVNRNPGDNDSLLVPTPPAQRGKRTSHYKNMTADQLEKELRHVLRTAKVPPSSVEMTYSSYQQAQGAWPKAQREQNRRRWLINLLTTYSKPSRQFRPSERKSVAKLRQIFMTMKTKANLSTDQRQRILDSAMGAYDKSSVEPKDRPFYKRMALLQMIKNMAVDPAQALR